IADRANMADAARRVAKLFRDLGFEGYDGFSAKTILRLYRDPAPLERPADTAGDDDYPLSHRLAARILTAAGAPTRADEVYDWYRAYLAAGGAALLHPFEDAVAFTKAKRKQAQ